MKKISRRSFLKVSGTMAAAGALAACGGSSSTSTAASSEAAPSVEAKAVDGLPDMSKETLNFSSDKVGSGSYNMIVAMSKVLEKAGGFQTVNVNPDSPGGMGAPYLFASGTPIWPSSTVLLQSGQWRKALWASLLPAAMQRSSAA